VNKILTAPEKGDINYDNAVFLAGSITGARDWQAEAIEMLSPFFDLVNPRRANYNALDPKLEEEQITWEFKQLRACRYILFWFSPETLAPITLYELGAKLMELKLTPNFNHTQIAIGADHAYKRRNDVIYQTHLLFPQIQIHWNLNKVCKAIVDQVYSQQNKTEETMVKVLPPGEMLEARWRSSHYAKHFMTEKQIRKQLIENGCTPVKK
jgi:hypothetical protein